MQYLNTSLTHLKLLLLKNYKLYRRNLKNALILYISPVVVVLLMLFWQFVFNQLFNFLEIEGTVYEVPKLQRCYAPLRAKGEPCSVLSYAVIGPREAWTEYAINYVARSNNLDRSRDIKFLGQINDPSQFYSHLQLHPNQTNYGVIFCTSQWPIADNTLSLPCTFSKLAGKKMVFYSIIYNWTLTFKSPFLQEFKTPYPKDPDLLRLKTSIDNGLVSFFKQHSIAEASVDISNQTNAEQAAQVANLSESSEPKEFMKAEYQDYPKVPTRLEQGLDIFSQYGSFYFLLPIMLLYVLTINDILKEKQKKLRQGICVMGVTHYIYWLSWFITSLAQVSLLELVQIAACYWFQIDIITQTPFLVRNYLAP